MAKKLLITGGSGFVGEAIAHYAHLKDFEVSVFDTRPFKAHANIEAIQGDITCLKGLSKAVQGKDCVIHGAANPNLWAKSSKQLMKVNYQGTCNVIGACRQHQVPKLIHISSDCTLTSPHNKVITEDSTTKMSQMKGAYCKSKWLAEEAVIQANHADLETMLINPGVPIGPTQQDAPFVHMLRALAGGKIKGCIDGRIGLIDVQDIAKLTIHALENGRGGKRYLGVSEVWALPELFKTIANLLQTNAPTIRVPFWLAKTAALFEQGYATCTNHNPLATTAGIYLAQHTHQIDSSATQLQLGLQFKPIEPALKKHGLIHQ